MKRLTHRLAAVGLALATASVGCFLFGPPLQAQTKSRAPRTQPPASGLSAGEGQERLLPEKNWNTDTAEPRQFEQVRRGLAPATNAELLDHAAQWYAYRLTHTEYQEPRGTFRGMHDLVKDAVEQIINVRDPKTTAVQRTYMEEFGKRFTARLREVVKNPKIIARLNAAIVLARLAAAGQENAVDVLVEIIQDPKENDGVKLYALRGLKDFFAAGHGESPFADKEREARAINALLQYVLHKPEVTKDTPPEEVAAVDYVRSEAITALGKTGYPAAANVVKKVLHIERPTAWVLLRVMRKDGFQPEPTLAEQVAAAAGVCQLHSKEMDQYNPDYVAYHVGRFLVEFASLYNNRAQDEKKQPWKIYAHHLSNALEIMKVELANPPANEHSAYVAKLAEQADRLLTPIQKGSSTNPQPNDLSAWLDQNPPKNQTVYKGMPEAVIHEGEKTAGG
jgi:hypothetical protein